MFSFTKKSQAGFSLVELMVVVAIIGVLASIAVPQVNKYLAKARQTEAKTILSSIYTSEKAFFAEYTAYDSRFGAIGYSPEGRLRYNAGFAAAGNTDAGAGNGFNTPPTGIGVRTNTGTYCGANGAFANGCAILNGADNSVPAAPTTTVNSSSTFTASANAVVYQTLQDTWSITETKNLRNVTPGIR